MNRAGKSIDVDSSLFAKRPSTVDTSRLERGHSGLCGGQRLPAGGLRLAETLDSLFREFQVVGIGNLSRRVGRRGVILGPTDRARFALDEGSRQDRSLTTTPQPLDGVKSCNGGSQITLCPVEGATRLILGADGPFHLVQDAVEVPQASQTVVRQPERGVCGSEVRFGPLRRGSPAEKRLESRGRGFQPLHCRTRRFPRRIVVLLRLCQSGVQLGERGRLAGESLQVRDLSAKGHALGIAAAFLLQCRRGPLRVCPRLGQSLFCCLTGSSGLLGRSEES